MYNLGVLQDKEFEELAKDLLEKELHVNLQIFKKGSDGGIDLRHSCDSENEIIVQAKHFFNSGYKPLLRELGKEIAKIQKLKPIPKRYIIFTSVKLSPQQADEILKLLSPFVVNTNDIYGFDRIQSILDNHIEVVEKHFKLWITSTIVLQRILNNAIQGQSEFYAEKIQKKSSLYVPTQNFKIVSDKLNENRFVIVTGAPGIGKTTISYLLLCDLMAKGYQLIYISDKIYSAEQLFSKDPEVKQIFYFDDFLGTNTYDILNAKNSESVIINFIERIQSSKNKFLILTTRTTILKQAEHAFEKFRQSQLGIQSKYEVELSAYSELDKAKILYNHLYHNNIPIDYFELVKKEKAYLRIIRHKNYSPRLIEFVTSLKNFKTSSQDYLTFIFNNFDNPHEIWKSAYELQLNDEDRFLLTTLFSLGGRYVKNEVLEKSFSARINNESQKYGYSLRNNAYNTSIKKLLESFISSTLDKNGENLFSFLNPSIGDFLLNYIKESKLEKWRIVDSVIYVEQLTNFFHPNDRKYITFDEIEISRLQNSLLMKLNSLELTTKSSNSTIIIEVLRLYLLFFDNKIDTSLINNFLSGIKPNEIDLSKFEKSIDVLNRISEYSNCQDSILKYWEELVNILYKMARYSDDYKQIRDLFDKYDRNYDEFFSNKNSSLNVINCLSDSFLDGIYDDANLSSSKIESVLEYYFSGNESLAESIIVDAIDDYYLSFIQDSGLEEYYYELIVQLDFEASRILQKIVRESSTENDWYSPNDFRNTQLRYQNESIIIDRLFE